MKPLALAAIAAAFALAAPAFAQKDNAKCKPNPVFEKFSGSYHLNCEQSRFAALELQVAKDPARLDGPFDKVTKEGEFWSYSDPIRKDAGGALPSTVELVRNFEAAVLAAKGVVLGKPQQQKAIVYRIEKGGSEYWGIAGCGSSGASQCAAVSHKIVRVKAMEQTIVISADQIAKDIGAGGKVVFYGIYFDTDKATLKAESGPTLAEMAKWLKDNAKARVHIVGHTDMQGVHDHNLKLSRDRAASVVAALTGQHGIAKDRLAAEGVGPLAPVASNTDEAGRAKNRRVEMVLR